MPGSTELSLSVERILKSLPAWFGVPETNTAYVESATRTDGFVARDGAEIVGVLLVRRHFPESAEVDLIAVAPEWHRSGIGRELISTLERDLRRDGCALLQVKTLGAAYDDEGYAKTRRFYRSVGFLPLEETLELWADYPCLILVKPL